MYGDPQLEGISKVPNFTLRSKEFVLHPNSYILPRRDKLPKSLALKTNRDNAQGNHGSTGDREQALKGFMHGLNRPRTRCKEKRKTV